MWLPAFLHGIALLISLCIQYNLNILAGMWLFPHLAACSIMLASSARHARNAAWTASLIWLIVIGFSVFVLQPVTGGASAGWVLAAAPMLAICMRPQYLKSYIAVSFSVVLLYGLGLILQVVLHMHYTVFDYPSHLGFNYRLPAWPLLDPNNAACIMVIGLVPSFYMCLERRALWLLPASICLIGLLLTECKAGLLAAGIASLVLLYHRLNRAFTMNTIAWGMLVIAAWVPFYWAEMILSLINSVRPRLDIWSDAWPLLWQHPLRGLGMGTFHIYYAGVRHADQASGGFYAHNDFLQLAIETGIPCSLALVALIIAIACTTCKNNLPAACTLLAIGIMSFLEFQLYEWPVSLLAGVALGYHIIHVPVRRYLL